METTVEKKKIIALHENPEVMAEVKKTVFELDGYQEALNELKKEHEALHERALGIQKRSRTVQKALMKKIRDAYDLQPGHHFKVDLDYVDDFDMAFLLMKPEEICEECGEDHSAQMGGAVVVSGEGSQSLNALLQRVFGQKPEEDDDDDDDNDGTNIFKGAKLN
jgi:hypothetical protein